MVKRGCNLGLILIGTHCMQTECTDIWVISSNKTTLRNKDQGSYLVWHLIYICKVIAAALIFIPYCHPNSGHCWYLSNRTLEILLMWLLFFNYTGHSRDCNLARLVRLLDPVSVFLRNKSYWMSSVKINYRGPKVWRAGQAQRFCPDYRGQVILPN